MSRDELVEQALEVFAKHHRGNDCEECLGRVVDLVFDTVRPTEPNSADDAGTKPCTCETPTQFCLRCRVWPSLETKGRCDKTPFGLRCTLYAGHAGLHLADQVPSPLPLDHHALCPARDGDACDCGYDASWTAVDDVSGDQQKGGKDDRAREDGPSADSGASAGGRTGGNTARDVQHRVGSGSGRSVLRVPDGDDRQAEGGVSVGASAPASPADTASAAPCTRCHPSSCPCICHERPGVSASVDGIAELEQEVELLTATREAVVPEEQYDAVRFRNAINAQDATQATALLRRLSDAVELVMDELGWDHGVIIEARLGRPEADALTNLRAVYESVHGLSADSNVDAQRPLDD